jgi:hypothetical protein
MSGFQTEGNFIFKMEVSERILPKSMDWLSDYEDEFDDEEFKSRRYELFFPTFEDMSKKLDEITAGCHQYWADAHFDIYGNNVESLEYHNGRGEWDKEFHIEISRIYLTDDLLESIKIVAG